MELGESTSGGPGLGMMSSEIQILAMTAGRGRKDRGD